MRLDKYLKVSRLIKRRTVANEACDAGRVLINEKTVTVPHYNQPTCPSLQFVLMICNHFYIHNSK